MPALTSTFTAISESTKCHPEPGESFEAYAKRLVDRVIALPDRTWDAMPTKAQNWHNANMQLVLDGKFDEVNPLEGFEEVPLAEPAPDEVELAASEVVDKESDVSTVEHHEVVAPARRGPSPRSNGRARGKPAKSTKTARRAKAAHSKAGRRPSFDLDKKIKLIDKDYAPKEGSWRDKNFKIVKKHVGDTARDAIAAGAAQQQIWSLLFRKVIALT